MSDEPVRDPGRRPSRQIVKARRIAEDAELETFRYRVRARMLAECDRADSETNRVAYGSALKAELALLADGVREAGGSAAALELVADKVSGARAANNARLFHRFGG
jgi:hypothetical protein